MALRTAARRRLVLVSVQIVGSGAQGTADGTIYTATLSNPYCLAFHPVTNELFWTVGTAENLYMRMLPRAHMPCL